MPLMPPQLAPCTGCSNMLLLPGHQLIMCGIEKNGLQALADLFCSLNKHTPSVSREQRQLQEQQTQQQQTQQTRWWWPWTSEKSSLQPRRHIPSRPAKRPARPVAAGTGMPQSGHSVALSQNSRDVRVHDGVAFETGCGFATATPEGPIGINMLTAWRLLTAPRDATAAHPWTRVVFVRDPLERFLSGYLSKCTPGHDIDTHLCSRTFGHGNVSFRLAAQRIHASGHDLPSCSRRRDVWDCQADDHWRMQSSFCNGTVGRAHEVYDAIERLDVGSSRDVVADLLRRVGVPKPESNPAFARHFPSPSSSVRRKPGSKAAADTHATHAAELRARYYADTDITRMVLEHYAPDYRALRMHVPAWAAKQVGEGFVRRLGLLSASS
jgi:hypothetical protein